METQNKIRIYFTGVGGQGSLTATSLLARTALHAGLDVVAGEVHGMAQRGGVVQSVLLLGGWRSPKLDLGEAVLKQNGFTGASSVLVRFASATDAHLVGGTLEGDYWEHDYAGSPNNSEWPTGFFLAGDTWYCSVEGVKVAEITGYGGQNGIAKDAKGWLSFFFERLPAFAPGGLDPKTGEVDASDKFRFTTDFKDLQPVLEKGRGRLQISKFLGYQGRVTRSWQMTVAWYDAEKRFLSAETAWQYREMWIPEGAAFLRVSVEEESAEAADQAGLVATAFRLPVNCAVRDCTFERCRCVGYAASAMKNMLFEGNFFTTSGESAACCAFDAEDGWDQMQDVYFLRNVFRDNPRNNSILTCAGHNFVLEGNDGDIYFWGRTHSPCVRGNRVGTATYRCDSRLRSGYGRFDGNEYAKAVHLGVNDNRADSWDYVLAGLDLDGGANPFALDVGPAGLRGHGEGLRLQPLPPDERLGALPLPERESQRILRRPLHGEGLRLRRLLVLRAPRSVPPVRRLHLRGHGPAGQLVGAALRTPVQELHDRDEGRCAVPAPGGLHRRQDRLRRLHRVGEAGARGRQGPAPDRAPAERRPRDEPRQGAGRHRVPPDDMEERGTVGALPREGREPLAEEDHDRRPGQRLAGGRLRRGRPSGDLGTEVVRSRRDDRPPRLGADGWRGFRAKPAPQAGWPSGRRCRRRGCSRAG